MHLRRSIWVFAVLLAALLVGGIWVLVVRAGVPASRVGLIDKDSSPVPVVTHPADQGQQVVASDGAGGVIIAWRDTRVPPTDTVSVWLEGETVIYAQRVLSSGNFLWKADGIPVVDLTRPISEEFYLHSQPVIVADGVGGALISFLNDAGNPPGVYIQRLDGQGEMVWRDRYRYGHEIANMDENLMDYLVMASDGAEGAILVWGLYTDKGGRLYAQRVDRDGDKSWEKSVPLFTNFQNDTNFDPLIVPDGSGGAIVVWSDYRSSLAAGIYAQRLDQDGDKLWGVDGMPVVLNATDDVDFKPRVGIAADGLGGVFVTWDSQIAGRTRVYAQYLDENGDYHWPASVLVSDHTEPETTAEASAPAITPVGDGGVYVVWRRQSPVSIRAHRLSPDGTLLWGEAHTRGVNLSSDSAYSNVEYPTVVSDDEGGAFVAWECSYTDGTNFYRNICLQHLHQSGGILCGSTGVEITPLRQAGAGAALLPSKTRGVIATWKDLPTVNGTDQFDIYAQLGDAFCAAQWVGEADVMLRDHQQDSGIVPSNTPWWNSPDVWVREHNDFIEEHQNPLEGQENTVYVRVHNRGSTTARDVSVHVYHAAFGLVSAWPDDWTEIISTTISTLGPQASQVVALPWTPASTEPTSLLVQVRSEEDPVTLAGDVPGDNNIALKNVQIIQLEDDLLDVQSTAGLESADVFQSAETVFLLNNPQAQALAADVVIELRSLAQGGSLSLDLGPELFDRWQAAGGKLVGAEVLTGTTRISVTSPVSATLIGIPLEAAESAPLTATLTAAPTDKHWLYIDIWERIAGEAAGGLVLRAPVNYELTDSAKRASVFEITQGGVVTYTLTLSNSGNLDHTAVTVTDSLPLSLTYLTDSLVWSAGKGTYADGKILWTGPVSLTRPTSITYKAKVNTIASAAGVITNTATVNDGINPIFELRAIVDVVAAPIINLYHPLVYKGP
jgi:uncharacterized repeat protein (TIGR01451 family)